jgi:hypothetical protein
MHAILACHECAKPVFYSRTSTCAAMMATQSARELQRFAQTSRQLTSEDSIHKLYMFSIIANLRAWGMEVSAQCEASHYVTLPIRHAVASGSGCLIS